MFDNLSYSIDYKYIGLLEDESVNEDKKQSTF